MLGRMSSATQRQMGRSTWPLTSRTNMGGNNNRDVRTEVSEDGLTLSTVFVLGGDFNKSYKVQNKNLADNVIDAVGYPYDAITHQMLYGGLAHTGQKMLEGHTEFGIKYNFGLPFVCDKRVVKTWTESQNTHTLKVTLTSREAKHRIVKKGKDETVTLDDTDSDSEDSPVAKRYRSK